MATGHAFGKGTCAMAHGRPKTVHRG